MNSFNPRTHEECDYDTYHRVRKYKMVSIHALTKSATATPAPYPLVFSGFNPRTHEECDFCSTNKIII